ncbi:hypothetical protein RV11_GL003203 [Enterococcus phoeniculicola]|nr:hypothetical protein RV11_GL003203 [Enterococcus phoeniculicola]
MYPSKEFPNYGVFVKNFVSELSETHEVQLIFLTKKIGKRAKLIAYLRFYFSVFRAYCSKNYELTYVHYAGYNSPPILAGRLVRRLFNRKMTLIVNVHGSDVTPEKKLEERTNFLTKWLVKRADLTIVPSSYFKEVVEKKYGKVQIFISASAGINLDVFSPSSKGKNQQSFMLGYVSRIDEEKGWDLLILGFKRILSYIPEAKLTIVGSGAQDEEANQLIHELHLEEYVNKQSILPQNDLVDIYRSFDVFVFPSTRAGESLGLVGLEAMACGVPVIGSDFGGIKTYVESGKNGYLFTPKNQEELIEKIITFYSLTQKQKRSMSKYAQETAHNYDSKKVNRELIQKISSYIK